MNVFTKAFTLIELMTVVAIMALMMGLAGISATNVRDASQDTRRTADLKKIQSALARFNSDCGQYPSTLPTGGAAFTGNNIFPGCYSSNVYLNPMPQDPNPTLRYYYAPIYNGTFNNSYILCASLNEVDVTYDVTQCGSCGTRACNISFTN